MPQLLEAVKNLKYVSLTNNNMGFVIYSSFPTKNLSWTVLMSVNQTVTRFHRDLRRRSGWDKLQQSFLSSLANVYPRDDDHDYLPIVFQLGSEHISRKTKTVIDRGSPSHMTWNYRLLHVHINNTFRQRFLITRFLTYSK